MEEVEVEEECYWKEIRVVRALYEALNSRDVETVHRLLAPDLEWWFHGPPSHQHLMRLLTAGYSSSSSSTTTTFLFLPQTLAALGAGLVIAEGHNEECNVSWVHAWTLTNGTITHVREYFNTSLTVARLGNIANANANGNGSPGSEPSHSQPSSPPTTSTSTSTAHPLNCQSTVWQSKLCDNKSVPGLVLAL